MITNFCGLVFDKHFGLFFAETSLLDQKIQYHENQTFLFCLSINYHDGNLHRNV